MAGTVAIILHYFTQNSSFQSQLCQIHTVCLQQKCSSENEFLAVHGLWGTTRAIAAVAELLVGTQNLNQTGQLF